jgi:hypothetical protein
MNAFQKLLAILIAVCAMQSAAACIIPMPLDERIEGAAQIVLGRYHHQLSYRPPGERRIYTLYVLEVLASLKGETTTAQLAIIAEGGLLGAERLVAYPNFYLTPGQEVLVFLDQPGLAPTHADYASRYPELPQRRPYAGVQGVLPRQRESYYDFGEQRHFTEAELFAAILNITGQVPLNPQGGLFEPREPSGPPSQSPAASIASLFNGAGINPPAGFIAGTTDPENDLIINGSGFGTSPGSVWFFNADNGGSGWITLPVPSDLVFWSDTQIRVKIPARAGTGLVEVDNSANQLVGSAPITIQYSAIAIYSDFANFPGDTRILPRLADINLQGGYTFIYNNNQPSPAGAFANNTAAVEAFERALVTWRCNTGVAFERDSNGAGNGAPDGGDGVCVVAFSNTAPIGTLGTAYSYFSAWGNGVCDQENTRWYLDNVDLTFNSAINWNFGPGPTGGGQFDFETVALHELGHAHGLAHVIASAEVMHFALGSGQDNRTLSSSDLAGGNYLMARATVDLTPCNLGVPPMVPIGAGCAVLPVELLSFEARRMPGGALLSWSTAMEQDNDYFSLERSADGRDFVALAQIAGSGHTHLPKSYSHLDEAPLPGANYYRLWQTDYDGSRAMLGVAEVSFPVRQAALAVQQPLEGELLRLSYDTARAGKLELRLFDYSGRLLHHWSVLVEPGRNPLELALPALPAGAYCLQALQGREWLGEKVVKF